MKIYMWGTDRLVGKVIGRYIDLSEIEAFIDNDRSKKSIWGRKCWLPKR